MRYKIKKVKVFPKGDIRWGKGVYLGMSMNNTMFRFEKTLNEILEILTTHTDSYIVLVGDHLHRYNEMIFDGCSENTAISSSIEKGELLKDFYRIVADRFPVKVNYEFITTADIFNSKEYLPKIERLRKAYNNNTLFQQLVNYTIDIFLRRQSEVKVPLDTARHLCGEYILEELAIFEILAERGYKVNIYPGNQLPIIKQLIAGNLKGVSETLENIQAVEIKFKPY